VTIGGTRSAPVALTGVAAGGVVRDLIFLTTDGGTLVALDAQTGATVWSKAHGGHAPTWTTAAIDPSLSFVYTYGLEGKVHKHNVGDGSEVIGGGWPETASLKPTVEQSAGALTIATTASGTFLYIIHSGYFGDGGDYQGHLTTIDLATGAQSVFNSLCSAQGVHFTTGTPDCGSRQSGAWARSGAMYDSDNGKVYFVTGNGPFNGSSNWGESVIALGPNGTAGGGGHPLDSYTPTNQATLTSQDNDLGSSLPVILAGTSLFPHLAAHIGKDRKVRLLNLDNLSGQGAPGHVGGEISHTALPQGGEVQNSVATWTNPADGATWVFIAAPNNGLAGMKVSVDGAGHPSIAGAWTRSGAAGSPLVANDILYVIVSNAVHALDPTTGNQLWSGATAGGVHWQSPVVANSVLYVVDNGGHLTAFGLPSSSDAGATDAGAIDASATDAAAANVRINAGGPAVAPFAADELFTGGRVINHANPINVSGVINPAPAAVYQTARIGNFSYTIGGFAPGSSHLVRLHFAETFWTAAGKRVFNASINGATFLSGFDVFTAAGAMNKAVVRETTASADSGGRYVIVFTTVVDNSLVSGIEIE
jgi:hypothetical protein